jgi:hypothetical protein
MRYIFNSGKASQKASFPLLPSSLMCDPREVNHNPYWESWEARLVFLLEYFAEDVIRGELLALALQCEQLPAGEQRTESKN